LSREAKNVIRGLLEIDPKRRTTACDLLKCDWFARHEEEDDGCVGERGEEEGMTEEMTAMRRVLLTRTSQRLKDQVIQKRSSEKRRRGGVRKGGGGGNKTKSSEEMKEKKRWWSGWF
jgi:hypothetical protein